MKDCIVIGGGPAGLSASIYLKRFGLDSLLICDTKGGQMSESGQVDNYLGISDTTGLQLTKMMFQHLEDLNCEILNNNVVEIKKENSSFFVSTEREKFQSKSIILATGAKYKVLNIPGEKEFLNKGISYCTICDAFFFKNQIVAVIGGGNSALDSALVLSKIAKKVFLINKNSFFKGEKILLDSCLKTENIEIIYDAHSTNIFGQNNVEELEFNQFNEKKKITIDGIFIKIGMLPNSYLVKNLVQLNNYGEIIVQQNKTSLDGLFAAGDVTDIKNKQIIISASDGANAAIEVKDFLKNI